ncbi:NAD(P)-binding protein [Pluteus cervinus]|uniref:NAD(P)-binding protein n=1 Tax=Pluteus cervinus TaxID=181527 RepID=A0ACD3BD34_9AGAR|nr:NAD(P)-binding protein [Pluteus cervinus]
MIPLLLPVLLLLFLTIAYIKINDSHIKAIPDRVTALSPNRWTPEYIRNQAEKFAKEQPKRTINDQLPSKTGRRYIIVGGSGFLGGWIVNQLLERGENPKYIRIIDLRPPTRTDLLTGPALQIQFIPADITSPSSIQTAFTLPWPSGVPSDTEITVFHTAANIRFYERHPSLLPFSSNVNVKGTQNVVEASKSIGATILIYTSSASVAVRRTNLFLWPWQKEPENFVQIINDSEESENPLLPRKHEEYFSNYAVSKITAEKYVRAADKSPTGTGNDMLRTGAIRPGNGVYGPGDMFCDVYLIRKSTPSWVHNSVQSFMYVENCALAHLLYEARLIESSLSTSPSPPPNPDLGGQFFNIADPGPTPNYGDVYTQLGILSNGETQFPVFSATGMLMVAYMVEWYYLMRFRVLGLTTGTSSWSANAKEVANGKANGQTNGTSSHSPTAPAPLKPTTLTRILSRLLPPLPSDMINLQPTLFFLTSVHAIFDDSRARLHPSKGGLGYQGVWNTFEGICRTVDAHYGRG